MTRVFLFTERPNTNGLFPSDLVKATMLENGNIENETGFVCGYRCRGNHDYSMDIHTLLDSYNSIKGYFPKAKYMVEVTIKDIEERIEKYLNPRLQEDVIVLLNVSEIVECKAIYELRKDSIVVVQTWAEDILIPKAIKVNIPVEKRTDMYKGIGPVKGIPFCDAIIRIPDDEKDAFTRNILKEHYTILQFKTLDNINRNAINRIKEELPTLLVV